MGQQPRGFVAELAGTTAAHRATAAALLVGVNTTAVGCCQLGPRLLDRSLIRDPSGPTHADREVPAAGFGGRDSPGRVVCRCATGWLAKASSRRCRVCACCVVLVETPASRGDTAHREDLVWLESTLRDHEVLADGAHILRHYLGPRYPIAALSVSYDGDALLLRERGEYRLLTIQDTAGRFVLIWAGRPGFPASARHIPALAGACNRPSHGTALRLQEHEGWSNGVRVDPQSRRTTHIAGIAQGWAGIGCRVSQPAERPTQTPP